MTCSCFDPSEGGGCPGAGQTLLKGWGIGQQGEASSWSDILKAEGAL